MVGLHSLQHSKVHHLRGQSRSVGAYLSPLSTASGEMRQLCTSRGHAAVVTPSPPQTTPNSWEGRGGTYDAILSTEFCRPELAEFWKSNWQHCVRRKLACHSATNMHHDKPKMHANRNSTVLGKQTEVQYYSHCAWTLNKGLLIVITE